MDLCADGTVGMSSAKKGIGPLRETHANGVKPNL